MMSRRAWLAAPLGLAASGAPATGWRASWSAPAGELLLDLAGGSDAVIACAGQHDASKSPQGFLLYSSEPGRWLRHALPEPPRSLFLGPQTQVWMAGPTGLWRSSDQGRLWEKKLAHPHLLRLVFADSARGFACGLHKTVLETSDGGESWTPVAAAAAPETNPQHTVYHWIHFATPRVGLISGVSRPPRKGRTGPLPAWRDPDPNRRPEWPAASLTLETRDGGRTWKHSVTSLFGTISRVRYDVSGRGLALIEFHDRFEYPSEVFAIDLRTGQSKRVFRRPDRAVTDLLLFAGGDAFLAAVAPPERQARATLGALHILRSSDLVNWQEMPAPEPPLLCGRAWLAGSSHRLALATDTGHIFETALEPATP